MKPLSPLLGVPVLLLARAIDRVREWLMAASSAVNCDVNVCLESWNLRTDKYGVIVELIDKRSFAYVSEVSRSGLFAVFFASGCDEPDRYIVLLKSEECDIVTFARKRMARDLREISESGHVNPMSAIALEKARDASARLIDAGIIPEWIARDSNGAADISIPGNATCVMELDVNISRDGEMSVSLGYDRLREQKVTIDTVVDAVRGLLGSKIDWDGAS